ncbi:MAG: hypothetical protein HY608_11655 [Planctomycetes bacterium]|nr:hypothetical protein [Planctomycetota bacterium]
MDGVVTPGVVLRGAVPRAVGLLSGGLDSTLAMRLMQEQGIEVHAVNFFTPFCNCNRAGRGCEAAHQGGRLGIPVKVLSLGRGYLRMVRNPPHGYGRAMNPCVDCRIMMYRAAAAYAARIGAAFLVTGEVVGQRPMSQRREALRTIDREAGVEGKVLRPLCARLLSPTDPELAGIVDRTVLGRIEGRGRRSQIDLAAAKGIADYPCASGGCLLTEPLFARKLKDLFDHDPDPGIPEVNLLKIGRHFRLPCGLKLVVGRDERENAVLEGWTADLHLDVPLVPGPCGLGIGRAGEGDVPLACSIVARYSDAPRDVEASVRVRGREGEARTLCVRPASPRACDAARV